jgi:hypothetical protein
MALIEPRKFSPKAPPVERLESADLICTYDSVSDTFLFHLYGPGRPGVSLPTSDFEYLRLDPVTEEVIGFQVEDFLAHAVYADPTYLELAELANIDPEQIAAIRRTIETRQRSMAPDLLKRELAGAMARRLIPSPGVA